MNERKRDRLRHARFIAYFRSELGGDRRRLAEKTKYSKGRLTQVLAEDATFAESAAANMARRLGLPDEYFERDREDHDEERLREAREHPDKFDYEDKRRAEFDRLKFLWGPLFPEQRNRLLAAIEREHQFALSALEEVKRRGWSKPDVPEDVLPGDFTRPAQRDLPIEPPAKEVTKGTGKRRDR